MWMSQGLLQGGTFEVETDLEAGGRATEVEAAEAGRVAEVEAAEAAGGDGTQESIQRAALTRIYSV